VCFVDSDCTCWAIVMNLRVTRQDNRPGIWDPRFWSPVILGVYGTVVAVAVTVALTGGGHTNMWLACVLFPYAMIVDDLPWPGPAPIGYFIVVWTIALLQFPAYGVLFGLVRANELDRVIWRLAVIFHVFFAFLATFGTRVLW
jgi:hypothetical protein